MADNDKRLRYYNGQFLRQQDFIAEQEYHLDRQRGHNQQLHTPGIADRLAVTADVGSTSATVSPGTAIDGQGRMIVLTESRTVRFEQHTGWVLVVISYHEEPSDPATSGDEGDTRWWERPAVDVIAEADAPAADLRIRLARLLIDANHMVSQHDTSVRTAAGSKIATGNLKVQNPLGGALQTVQDQNGTKSSMMLATTHVEINTDSPRCPVLTVAGNVQSAPLVEVRSQKNEASVRYLSLDNADKVAWHVGTGGAGGPKNFFFWNDATGPVGKVVATITPEGNAAVTGNLSVAGHVQVTGTVDGRDVSADGARLDQLASSTLEGVSNPGGNIDLVGQAGITVTGNNATKTITIANAAGSLTAQNPLGPSPQFVQDQNGNKSSLAIGTGNNVGIGTNTPGCLLTVAGNISAAPTAEMYSQGDESSIRYVNNSGMAWHAGSGGHGGAKNFFFWSQSNGIVGTITPEGSLTVNGGFTARNVPAESTAPNPNELKTLMIDPTGRTYKSAASQPSTYLRRAVLRAHFDDKDANGKTLTLEAGFQPKFISMEGRSHAKLSDIIHGGAMGGFGRCFDDLSIYSTGHGPFLLRLTHVPYISFFNHVHDVPGNNALGCTDYRDLQQIPNLHVFIELIVEAVTPTGFRLKMNRRTDAGCNPPMFGLDLVFAVLG